MFLPVLLIRDLGFVGWVIFAIPNVIGAALVGFVWKSPEHSTLATTQHRGAMQWFSIATISLHGYVLLGILPHFGIPLPWLLATMGMAVLAVAGVHRNLWAVLLSLVVLGVSLTTLANWLTADFKSWPRSTANTPQLPASDVWLLAPAIAAGFLTCPHLDLTLHRARQALPNRWESYFAFGFGFGVLFFWLIVLTAIYAIPAAVFDQSSVRDWLSQDRLFFLLALHIGVQSIFTVGLHIHALGQSSKATESQDAEQNARQHTNPVSPLGLSTITGSRGIITGILALVLAGIVGWVVSRSQAELGYRLFILLYGIPFPAYVVCCMLPIFRRASNSRKLIITGLITVLAYPASVVAFGFAQTLWLLGVYVVFTVGVVWLWIMRGQSAKTSA